MSPTSDDLPAMYDHYLDPAALRLHDLRHGAATLALAGGSDLEVVSEMLDDSAIAMTADTDTS